MSVELSIHNVASLLINQTQKNQCSWTDVRVLDDRGDEIAAVTLFSHNGQPLAIPIPFLEQK